MSDSPATPGDPPAGTVRGALNLVSDATRHGAADARAAAARTLDGVGRFLNRFLYTTCYTISYGVTVPALLLARKVPKDHVAIRGLIDGADAAKHRVDEMLQPAPGSLADAPHPALVPA